MTSIAIDRLDGLSSATAIKGPCHAATTGNITLSGIQTIDGQAGFAGMRVLVKDQNDQRENGIWIMDTGLWRRSRDFSRNDDLRQGTQVFVFGGDAASRTTWFVETPDPISIGNDAIILAQNSLATPAVWVTVNGTVEPGSSDVIDLGMGTDFDGPTMLYLDGVYQFRNTYSIVDGEIVPVGTWPSGGDSGISVEVNVLVSGSVVSPVPDGTVTRAKLNISLNHSVFLAPQEYGAKGDGSDDTAALAAWAAACQDEGLQPFIPPGDYRCASVLDFSTNGGNVMGAGENVAKVIFTNPLSAGFRYHPSGAGSEFGGFSVEKLGIQTATVIPAAISVILPNDGDFTNHHRVGYRNLEIIGLDDGYFEVGIRERNVSFGERRKVRYWGSATNPTALSGYYDGIAFDFDTQTIGDDPANGLSIENQWYGCTANFCHTGARIRGFPEGMYFHGNNFAFVRRGIDAEAETGTRQPLISVIGNHINASEWGVSLNRYSQSHVLCNHIGRPSDAFAHTWTGARLVDSINAVVSGNIILPEAVSPSAGDTYGVRLTGDSWFASIGGNQFVGAISGSYKPLTAAILIDSGVNGTRIGPDNQYTQTITDYLVDNSGNTTNVFTGVTVQSDGVTVGPVSGVTLINFSDDFTVNVSGSSVSVALAP